MIKDYCIGIDLGGTNIKTSIFKGYYNKVAESRIPTHVELGSEKVLCRMLQAIQSLLDEKLIDIGSIRCIGIGVPGLMDIERGISKFSPNFPYWENVPVSEWFQEKLHVPTFIDNDVRVNLYGEWRYGAGKDKQNVVLLTLGTGLGSGIVMDGHVIYGTTGSAGEIGHMNMYRRGRPCKCGSSGCLGRYVSALGMLRTLKEKLQSGRYCIITQWVGKDYDKITAKMVSDAYDAGDDIAVETMNETGEILGYGLTNIINLYNPETIIVGGGMSTAGERLLKPARRVVETHAIKISQSVCSIVVASLGDSAGMLGAAVYADSRLDTNSRI